MVKAALKPLNNDRLALSGIKYHRELTFEVQFGLIDRAQGAALFNLWGRLSGVPSLQGIRTTKREGEFSRRCPAFIRFIGRGRQPRRSKWNDGRKIQRARIAIQKIIELKGGATEEVLRSSLGRNVI
jgi:hypothetical protein